MNYKSIKLEKGMYHHSNKSFTEVLESLDPSENYRGTPLENLDAFQRQLKRFDIKVKGAGSDQVQKFYQTSDSAALFPEFLSRAIHQGMEEANVISDIVATKTKIDSMDYRSIASTPTDDEKRMEKVGEGEEIPETKVHLQDHLVKLSKRGRSLSASYEAIQYQKLDLFTVTLKQIGAYLATTLLEDAVDVVINGDGGNNPATQYNTAESGTITYSDLLDLWGKFGAYQMNTMLASPDVMLKILGIKEFQNPITGLNFQGTGVLNNPLGSKLIRSSAVPEGKLIALDKRFALEQVIARDITVESDKLIDKQLSRSTITTITGFAKIFKEALAVLNVNQN
ncbi:MAG: phage major capsid protein [Oscillospiraceae bacterium]|nr:phage major capsid protein [Oscillospiraceae bacterium]